MFVFLQNGNVERKLFILIMHGGLLEVSSC